MEREPPDTLRSRHSRGAENVPPNYCQGEFQGGLKNTTIGALSHAMNAVKVQQHNQHDLAKYLGLAG